MSIQYLFDENLSPLYREQLLRLQPDLTVWMIGDPGVPPKSTLDPEILIWCEQNEFVLVTNNRTSMPVHLADHLQRRNSDSQAFECHIPGIFVLRPKATIGAILEDLILIAQVGIPLLQK